jgi:hypothetical protein
MDFLRGFLFIWLFWGVSMLIMNIKGLSNLAISKLPLNRTWHSILYFPVWLLMCIMSIIIYPPMTVKRHLLNLYNKHSKKNAKL